MKSLARDTIKYIVTHTKTDRIEAGTTSKSYPPSGLSGEISTP